MSFFSVVSCPGSLWWSLLESLYVVFLNVEESFAFWCLESVPSFAEPFFFLWIGQSRVVSISVCSGVAFQPAVVEELDCCFDIFLSFKGNF
jgi:hypothetical protein